MAVAVVDLGVLAEDDSEQEGDITGIIEADGLVLEELQCAYSGQSSSEIRGGHVKHMSNM